MAVEFMDDKCWSCGGTRYIPTLFGDVPCKQCAPEPKLEEGETFWDAPIDGGASDV